MAASPQDWSQSSVVVVRDVSKSFQRRSKGLRVNALSNVSVDVRPREILVLLGPSGCGKSTLLRSIAGLETPGSGTIEISGRVVFDPAKGIQIPASRRQLAMVFQSYALWPHMTVLQNVAYPLRCAGVSRAAAATKAEATLKKVRLDGLEREYPSTLSGGQQQRVALARCLVSDPPVILFDEPLSNVDARVREELREELKRMQADLGFAAIYVTHDQGEALALADRIAVMDHGRIVQLGSPEQVYLHPTSRYVAEFVGSGTILAAEVAAVSPQGFAIRVDGVANQLRVGPAAVSSADGSASSDVGINAPVWLVLRPEDLMIEAATGAADNAIPAMLTSKTFMGDHIDVVLDVGGHHALKVSVDRGVETPDVGAACQVRFSPEAGQLIRRDPADTPRAARK